MLKRCEDTNLVLNWEKSHFMVKEGIVLGHKISKSGIEVDRAKVDVITKLPHPTTVKGVRSFLGHAGFYRRFIQDFSKIARPMTHLLEKETPFFFSKECIESFNTLKRKLTEAPILIAPDWDLPFELMCDASDFAIGAVLGQRKNKHFQPIHYASKTMTEAQAHYTTTEKELLAVVYAFENIRSYLISQTTMRGISLSRECHPNNRIRKFFKDVKTLTSGMTFCSQNIDADQMIRRCVHGKEALDILEACHNGPTGGHHGANLTAQKWGENRDSWSDKTGLADLWAFVTAYKTPLGSHSVQACIWKGLSSAIELEHKAYWALKCKTFDLKTPGGPGFLKPLVLAVFVLRSQELHNPQLLLGIPIS
ncbi:reverse transcriptase domain-containing protein [Tanacetum coccineum]